MTRLLALIAMLSLGACSACPIGSVEVEAWGVKVKVVTRPTEDPDPEATAAKLECEAAGTCDEEVEL